MRKEYIWTCTKKNSVRRGTIILIALLVLITSGCAKKNGGVSDETEATPTPAIVMPTAKPSSNPLTGGEIKMPMPTNADIYDPLAVNTEEMLSFFSLIFEGLVSIDKSGRIIPELAENWSCDESGKVWTLNIRNAARWQSDGTKVTAADVVYTYNRLIAMKDGSYYDYNVSLIENITAGENETVKVTMKQSGYSSLYALTFPIMHSSSQSTYPDGTGSYKVESVVGKQVQLSVNENWWKQRPYIESFAFFARDNNETALASYEAGQLDMVPTSSVSAGKYRGEGVTNVLDIMTQTCEVMLVNFDNEILSDLNVRKGIACALNRSRIITNVYMNRAQACDVPVAPDMWVYDSKSKQYDYNAALALSYFEESGYKDVDNDGRLEINAQRYNEVTLSLLVNKSTDTTRLQAAQLIAEQLGEVGITVEIIEKEYSLTGENSEYMAALKAGEFDLALMGVNLSLNVDVTQLLLANGSQNYGKYQNAAVARLASNILSAPNETSFADAASEFQLKFAEDLPFITLYFRLNSIIYSTDIKGVSNVREPDIMQNVNEWYMETVVD